MILTGTKTTDVDVDVPERTIIDFARVIVGREADIDVEEYFLNAEKTEVRANDEWRHGSLTDHLVRAATPADLKAFEVLKYLNDLEVGRK